MKSKYVIGKNGLFRDVENMLFRGRVKVEGDPMQEELKEEVAFVPNKIPRHIFRTAFAFGKYGRQVRKMEVALVLIYDRGEWKLKCPQQWNSLGHCHMHPELPPGPFAGWFGDIHFHPGNSSTHSMTDERDELARGNGIFIVCSGFTFMTCRMDIWGVFNGRRFKIEPETIVDEDSPEGEGTFPEEWKKLLHYGECQICERIMHAPLDTDKKDGKGMIGFTKSLLKGRKRDKLMECGKCHREIDHVSCPKCKKKIEEGELVEALAADVELALEDEGFREVPTIHSIPYCDETCPMRDTPHDHAGPTWDKSLWDKK